MKVMDWIPINSIVSSLTAQHLSYTSCSVSNSRQQLLNSDMIADVKSKIIVSTSTIFCIFLLFQKFKSIEIKLEKYSYTQTNTCLLHRKRETQRERHREKQGRGDDSCHISHQYFSSCLLCKHPTILFQNKNGILQYKN